MEENVYAPPKALVADVASIKSNAEVHFFAVSPVKLVVLSLGTLGVYQIYWFYKQWVLIKKHSEPHIVPWARAFFGILWCYSCFDCIRKDERSLDIKPLLLAGPVATGWIVLSLTWRLPEPYFLIGYLSPLLLIPVQQHVNRINTLVAPDHDKNSRFSVWNWLAVVAAGIFMVLVLIILLGVGQGA